MSNLLQTVHEWKKSFEMKSQEKEIHLVKQKDFIHYFSFGQFTRGKKKSDLILFSVNFLIRSEAHFK